MFGCIRGSRVSQPHRYAKSGQTYLVGPDEVESRGVEVNALCGIGAGLQHYRRDQARYNESARSPEIQRGPERGAPPKPRTRHANLARQPA